MVYIADFGIYEVVPMVEVIHKRKYRGRYPKWFDGVIGTAWFEHLPNKTEIAHYELYWVAN